MGAMVNHAFVTAARTEIGLISYRSQHLLGGNGQPCICYSSEDRGLISYRSQQGGNGQPCICYSSEDRNSSDII